MKQILSLLPKGTKHPTGSITGTTSKRFFQARALPVLQGVVRNCQIPPSSPTPKLAVVRGRLSSAKTNLIADQVSTLHLVSRKQGVLSWRPLRDLIRSCCVPFTSCKTISLKHGLRVWSLTGKAHCTLPHENHPRTPQSKREFPKPQAG